MKTYKNLLGNIGVHSYEADDEKIRIKYHTNKVYLYDHDKPGKEHVQNMRLLAERGLGLNKYINEHVKEKYAAILS